MYQRMKACRVIEVAEGVPTAAKFALVLVTYGGAGAVTAEAVAYSDTYAFVDYWATRFNIGARSVEECREGLGNGPAGIPQDPKSKSDFIDARFGGTPHGE
jgi:hypothetical protein